MLLNVDQLMFWLQWNGGTTSGIPVDVDEEAYVLRQGLPHVEEEIEVSRYVVIQAKVRCHYLRGLLFFSKPLTVARETTS